MLMKEMQFFTLIFVKIYQSFSFYSCTEAVKNVKCTYSMCKGRDSYA